MCAAQACATPKEQDALAPVKAGVAKRSQRIAAKVSEGSRRGSAAALLPRLPFFVRKQTSADDLTGPRDARERDRQQAPLR